MPVCLSFVNTHLLLVIFDARVRQDLSDVLQRGHRRDNPHPYAIHRRKYLQDEDVARRSRLFHVLNVLLKVLHLLPHGQAVRLCRK